MKFSTRYIRLIDELIPGIIINVMGKGAFAFLRISKTDSRYFVYQYTEDQVRFEPLSLLDEAILEYHFLDYVIVNSGNSDGWVPYKKSDTPGYQDYECNLGNYTFLNSAKKDCIRYFMIARPDVFAHSICNKMRKQGSGTTGEFSLMRKVIERNPDQYKNWHEISAGDGFNTMIQFAGEVI